MSAQENTRPTFSFKYSSTITYVIVESQESELCLNMVPSGGVFLYFAELGSKMNKIGSAFNYPWVLQACCACFVYHAAQAPN